MLLTSSQMRVYLALGNTDMRKAINGLSILVQESMELDPFSGHLFVFCNRRRNILKILYWDRNIQWGTLLPSDLMSYPRVVGGKAAGRIVSILAGKLISWREG
ncbi:MAG: transposase [Desulfobacteraceae bacterium Eth-SRB1]|nr:MAG: transposase [Desulfobacteraceae bacterium Eth-SRB1]